MSTAAPDVDNRRRRRRYRRPAGPRRRLRLPGRMAPGLAPLARLVRERPDGWSGPRICAAVVFGAILLGGLLAGPIVGWIGLRGPTLHDPAALNFFGDPTGPSAAHPLGVDSEGRDVLSRLLYGLRSLVLVSLAGAALGLLAGQLLAALARLNRWAARVIALVTGALRSFPPPLLGLALGLTLGPGVWRLIVALALAGLLSAATPGDLPGLAVRALAGAMALDFSLTFLGDGPGGTAPQLGAMVARAGVGIVAGVPAWWALLFPGLVVALALAAAGVLAPRATPADALGEPVRWGPRTPLGYAGAEAVAAVLRLAVICLVALVAFTGFGASGARGDGTLAAIDSQLSGTVSLIGGGALIWIAVTVGEVWWLTRRRRLPGLGRVVARPARLPGIALAAAPIGWLAFLAVYLFSDSVGQVPILPGPSNYVGITHGLGQWAHGLVMPWLLLGLAAAAVMGPGLAAAVTTAAGSGQQRVARAAGVPERLLTRQLRRGLIGPVLELSARWLGGFIAAAVIIEATFSIRGAGALTVEDFGRGLSPVVADVAVIAAAIVVLYTLAANLLRLALDPRLAQ